MSTTPAYDLHRATPADLNFLYEVMRATMRDYVGQTWGPWDEVWQRDRFAVNFRASETIVIVVEQRDAGRLVVRRSAAAIQIVNIEIVPEMQGRGVGTAILSELLAEAWAAGVPIKLRVLRVNPARHLYERLGFSVVGETPTHYLMSTSQTPRM